MLCCAGAAAQPCVLLSAGMDSQYGRDLRRDLIQVSIKAKKSARVVQQLQGPRRGFCGNWGLLLLLLFFAPQDFVFCGVGFLLSARFLYISSSGG